MRQNLILLLLLIAQPCFAQFSDDFSDFDLSVNPVWSGDINSFLTPIVNNLMNKTVLKGKWSYYEKWE